MILRQAVLKDGETFECMAVNRSYIIEKMEKFEQFGDTLMKENTKNGEEFNIPLKSVFLFQIVSHFCHFFVSIVVGNFTR